MERKQKISLLAYGILSAISFFYLVLPEQAGISVPVFTALQFVMVFWIYRENKVTNTKGLWLFIPLFILSLNMFTSGNDFLRIPNFLVSVLLYSAMILITTGRLEASRNSPKFIFNILENVLEPIRHFDLPVKWCMQKDTKKSKIAKKVLIGLMIALPCTVFLIIMLSSADEVFSGNVNYYRQEIFKSLNFNFIFKSICGLLAGLYLFGLVYIVFSGKKEGYSLEIKKMQGDMIILNIILVSILFVYTAFVMIQFKYLFAGANLPYGLNYSEYARRGFFELIVLSGLNVGLILITVYLLREKVYGEKSVWGAITKGLMFYLCAVTLLMLVSSFYRMSLYDNEYGFTQLRVLVYGFLIFEAAGIFITFIYIAKPKFNILFVYTLIGLCYYLTLNIVNIDYIIAKRNVDRYLAGQKADIRYTVSLSADAAPEIARLYNDARTQAQDKTAAFQYFVDINDQTGSYVPRWQRYNLSYRRAIEIRENLFNPS